MPRKPNNLVGRRFGKLTVIKDTGKRKWLYPVWLCQCDCGNTHEVVSDSLTREQTRSCGCLRKGHKGNIKHNHTTNGNITPEYCTWSNMKQRCSNKKLSNYIYYGGRGISVCKRWKDSFEDFLKDMGKKPEGMSIDRIDNDGDYTPENCKWSTQSEQNKNKRYNLK